MNLWEDFTRITRREFRFLETEFAFSTNSPKPPNIFYLSDKLYVQIYYDINGRKELDLSISKVETAPPNCLSSIGIGMLKRLKENSGETYLSTFPLNRTDLDREIKNLAEDLRKYGSELLLGDLSAFIKIKEIEEKLANQFQRRKIK